jgi:predicted transcriptional regulator
MNQPMRRIEIDEATARALERRAAEIGISVAAVVSELVLLDQQPTHVSAAELAELDPRWASVKAGEATVPHEKVAEWLKTWGEPDSKPWPEE